MYMALSRMKNRPYPSWHQWESYSWIPWTNEKYRPHLAFTPYPYSHTWNLGRNLLSFLLRTAVIHGSGYSKELGLVGRKEDNCARSFEKIEADCSRISEYPRANVRLSQIWSTVTNANTTMLPGTKTSLMAVVPWILKVISSPLEWYIEARTYSVSCSNQKTGINALNIQKLVTNQMVEKVDGLVLLAWTAFFFSYYLDISDPGRRILTLLILL